jgi:hypothetical protein
VPHLDRSAKDAMQRVPRYLKNFQTVIDAYGYWPTFHDSPVFRFQVDSDIIILEVEAWEMTSEVDDRGFFILTKKHQIGFRFSDITAPELSDFIPENILSELIFSTEEEYLTDGYFCVELESAIGSDLCGRFRAKSGEVTFIRQFDSITTKGEQDGGGNSAALRASS